MSKKDKLDKIITLLEEIKANQPIPYHPPLYYDPQPYIPISNPWQDGTTTWDGGNTTVC